MKKKLIELKPGEVCKCYCHKSKHKHTSGESCCKCPDYRDIKPEDWEAIGRDFDKVGEDMKIAFKNFEKRFK